MRGRYAFLVSSLLALAVAARGEGDGAPGGLAARWGFDELRGTTARDSSGNGNDISFAGCTGIGRTRGVLGGAVAFGRGAKGPSMHVGNKLLPGGRLWSASVWIKTVQPSGTIFYAGVPRKDRWALRVHDGRAVFEVSMAKAVGWKVTSALSVADGKWHHVVGVRTAVRQIALYVDGVLQQTLDTRGGSVISGDEVTFTLGSFAGRDPFVGVIDELAMHRRALAAGDVRELLAAVRGTRGAVPGEGAAEPGVVPMTPGGPPSIPATPTGPASIEEMLLAVGERPAAPRNRPSTRVERDPVHAGLDGFVRLLDAGDAAGAKALAERRAGSASGGEAEAFRAAARVAALLVERDAAVHAAASETVGRKVTLQLERGKVRGKVRSVTEAGIALLSTFTVNGTTRTTTRTVKWSELAPGQIEEFAAGWAPRGAEGAVAAAYIALVAEDAEAAVAAVTRVPGDHPLAAHVLERVSVLRLGEAEGTYLTGRLADSRASIAEKRAALAWASHIEPHLKTTRFPKSEAKELHAALRDFAREFAETEFVAEHSNEIAGLNGILSTVLAINLLPNGTFDAGGMSSWKLPPQAEGQVALRAGAGSRSSNAVELLFPHGALVSDPVSVRTGAEYTLRLKIVKAKVTSAVVARARVLADGRAFGAAYLTLGPAAPLSEDASIVVPFRAIAGAVQVEVSALRAAAGSIVIDDVMLTPTAPAKAAAPQPPVFLDDMKPLAVRVGWPTAGYHGDLGWDGERVSLNGHGTKHALSLHPASRGNSYARYDIGGKARVLRATAMINHKRCVTPVTFRVLGDGKEIWRSRPNRIAADPESFEVDVTGVRSLELYVDCPGSFACAHAVWWEARLLR